MDIQPGRYVVAVSGGVDSVVLLDMLTQESGLELVVAHFDHGIRKESVEDAIFVGQLAQKYHLQFLSERAELGVEASEATARRHRYEFLNKVKQTVDARAIITAHHQDDLIETALLNVLRGTQHKGLVSLQSSDELIRPLLNMSKDQLVKYAQSHELEWREDTSNQDMRYKRNELRNVLKDSLSPKRRQQIVEQLQQVKDQSQQIEAVAQVILSSQPSGAIDRNLLKDLDDMVACELVAEWLRLNQIGFDRKTVERVVRGNRQLGTGSQIDLQANYYCLLQKQQIVLMRRDSV